MPAENGFKTTAREALLAMARDWDKAGNTQHAIKAYEAVMKADSESKEAQVARESLLKIAEQFDKKGKKSSAYHLYHKLV